MNEFSIRPAKNEDIPFIKNVVFTVLSEYGLKHDENGKDRDLSDIEENYFKRDGFFGVLVRNTTKEIVGTFGLFSIDKEVCELRKMYLLKGARGKGFGKSMLDRAISIARKKGYKKITLETISPLKEAISLYKKFGFKEIPPHETSDRVNQAFELVIR